MSLWTSVVPGEVMVKLKEIYFKALYRPACTLLNVNVMVSV